jgi:hypothetical protein
MIAFKKYIAYIAVLTIALTAQAQAPGYMGKKVTVQYSGPVGISFPSYDEYEADDVPFMKLLYRHDLSVDYALSKSLCAGISFKHSSPTVYAATYTSLVDPDSYERFAYFDDFEFKINMLSAYVEFFSYNKWGAIAPLGAYKRLELGLASVTAEPLNNRSIPDSYYDYFYMNNLEDVGEFEKISMIPCILYTSGKQWIYFDKMIVDLGTQFGIPLTSGLFSALDDSNIYGGDIEEDFPNDAKTRLATSMLFSFQLGIGYVVF